MKNIPTLPGAPLIVVAAALLRADQKILLQKRPEGRSMAGLWEFPGGKQEANETLESALARELFEELDIVVDPENLDPACFASAAINERPLLLLLYICRIWQGEPTAVESPELGWFSVQEMYDLPMPPADLPLLDCLQRLV